MIDPILNVFREKSSHTKESYLFSKRLNNIMHQVKLLKETDVKVAIYGNGILGNIVLNALEDNVLVIADKEDEIQKSSPPLCTAEELIHFDFDFIIICVLGREREITDYLVDRLGFDIGKILTFNIEKDITTAYPILRKERDSLERLKNRYSAKRCFILGNGPSLNDIPFELLTREYTFASNFIYRKEKQSGFRPTFYMAEDRFVFKTKDFYKSIDKYKCDFMFFPSLHKSKIDNTNNNLFFELDYRLYDTTVKSSCDLLFSKDFSSAGYSYFSVIYLQLQLAYYLGFTEIYLLGVDYNYKSVYNDKHVHDVSTNEMLSGQFLGFKKAKDIFEQDGRSIQNATVGSKLEVFEKVEFLSLFKDI